MKKIKPLGKGSFASRVLRALGMQRGIEVPFTLQEEKKHPNVSISHDYIMLRNDMLEAERVKAKYLMECERHNIAR